MVLLRVHFITQGCTANVSDSEIMRARCGPEFSITNNADEADIFVLNTCTVRGESTALQALRKINREHPGKPVVVAGCVTPLLVALGRNLIQNLSFINTHGLGSIKDALLAAGTGQSTDARGVRPVDKIIAPKVRRNTAVGIIQCSSGCESTCAFCSTRLIKGRTRSYSIESIIKEAQRCVSEGCVEIWLTATDLGCYGADIETTLPELVRQVAGIPGKFMIRIGMASPVHVMKYKQQFAAVLLHPKVFKFAHLPHQSGSDHILDLMKRNYSFEQYRALVEYLNNTVPGLTLATDVIVGFPGESDAHFQETLESIRRLRPDVCNIARFVARPGTLAARLPGEVSSIIKKARSQAVHELFREGSLHKNRAWIGWEGTCTIEEAGKHDCVIVRNQSYKPIIVRENLLIGAEVSVRVVDATSIDLRAVLTSDL